MEAEKIEKAKSVEQKIAVAAQRRLSLTEDIKRQCEEKMESTKENRDRLISERIEKMKEHVRGRSFHK